MKRFALTLIGLSLASALVSACDKKDDNAAAPSAKPADPAPAKTAAAAPVAPAKPAPAALPAPDFTITARALYAEFRPQIEAGTADAVRSKYTGKTVRISGVVKDNADMMGTWELSLAANDDLGKAFLHPTPATLESFKAIKTGANLTFQCTSAGWEIGPQLNDCTVLP